MLGSNDKCLICDVLGKHSTGRLERHHIFNGALRSKSERYGLVVMLCHEHHNEPPYGVHFNRKNRMALCRMAQKWAMEEYGWTIDDFRKHFYKNYL